MARLTARICAGELNCYDGADNDGNGALDCEDAFCAISCVEVCDDSFDNDQDGAVDCADVDCLVETECPEWSAMVTGGSIQGQRIWPEFQFRGSVTGDVGVMGDDGEWKTCQWSVTTPALMFYAGHIGGSVIMTDPNCAGVPSDFLPTLATVPAAGLMTEVRTESGALWFAPESPAAVQHQTNTFQTSSGYYDAYVYTTFDPLGSGSAVGTCAGEPVVLFPDSDGDGVGDPGGAGFPACSDIAIPGYAPAPPGISVQLP